MRFRPLPAAAALSLALSLALALAVPVTAQVTAQDTISALPAEIADALSRRDYATARAALAPLAQAPDNPEAQFRYGVLLLQGQGGPRMPGDAVGFLEQAAARDHAASALLLARIFLTGANTGVERNPERAAKLLRVAAAQDNAEAQFYLSLLYRNGTGVEKDQSQAFTLLKSAAEGGYGEAQYELSKAYSRTGSGEHDAAEALRWLRVSANAGHIEAQFFLANALETGKGAPHDKTEALLWFRRAAEGGLPLAQRILGTKYLLGDEGAEPNAGEALRWLQAAAGANDPGAMNNLAFAYGGENGVPRDDAKALEWYGRASEAGLGRATYALAQYHETGRGTPADIKTAGLLYRLAAEQGDARGVLRLGYLTGQGALDAYVPPHLAADWALAAARTGDADALAWLRRQAEDGLRGAQTAYALVLLDKPEQAAAAAPFLQSAALAGDVGAQFQLGTLYTKGQGLPLDYVKGHKWLNIAATGGHPEAGSTRDLLGNLMTPEQIAEAQAEARVFFETASDRLPETVKTNRTNP